MKLLVRAAPLAAACAVRLRRARAGARATQVPLRLIVPFTPGTGIDLIARTVGPELGERLGRPVVVDNRAGASGNIGTEAVVRAPPDGHTLLVSVNTLVMNRSLYPQLPFDPVKDLVPVSLTSWGQLLLVTPARRPASRPRGDLVAAAKAQARARSTTPAPASARRTTCRWSCSSRPPACSSRTSRTAARRRRVTDLLGGQVDAMFLPIHVALPHVKAGKLVALGIGSEQAPSAAAATCRRWPKPRPARSTWTCGTASSRRPARSPDLVAQAQPRAEGHPGHARSAHRVRDAGHGPGHQHARGVPPAGRAQTPSAGPQLVRKAAGHHRRE